MGRTSSSLSQQLRVKPRLFLATALAMLLSAACVSPMTTPIDFLGEPATPSAAMRTIVIKPDTRWVNVTGGDIVKFMVGEKTFAWNFDVAEGVSSFDLNRVAPPGTLDHTVVAYVAPNPLYFGDGGGRGRHGGGHHSGHGGRH